MAVLDDVKLALRITSSAYDAEINDLIEAATSDLILSGVVQAKAEDTTDPLIKRAVVVFCKANFGYNNPDADRLQRSYEMLKAHLSLAQDYNGFAITFNITDGAAPIADAEVTFNGETKPANAAGVVVFLGVRAANDMKYTVEADDYTTVEGEFDVTATASVAVEMTAG